ncbi:MAG: sensor histidine kinase [Microbacteriaceae bacterium]
MTTDAPATSTRSPTPAPLTATQRRFDAILAAVLFVGGLISAGLSAVAGFYGDEQQGNMLVALAYVAALSLPLAFRRRWPCQVGVIVVFAFFMGVTLRVPDMFIGNIAMFIALYTVGAWSADRRRARIVRIVLIVAMFAWLLAVMFFEATAAGSEQAAPAGAFTPYMAAMLINLLINVLYFGGAYYLGDRAWHGRIQRDALEQRTAELEAERELTAAQAVALDRVNIARELHDVVAHHVSAMGVQAGAARAVMDVDPGMARDALLGVETSARDAIAELKQLLHTLRSSGDAEVEASTLTLDAVPSLVDAVRSAGMPVSLTIVGTPRPIAQLVQVNLYRITQEALTNARRHGGAGATAEVRLRYDAEGVEVEITNTGHAGAYAKPGMGQLGMLERAEVSGGTLTFGPRSKDRGGYLVRVRVPLGAGAEVGVGAGAGEPAEEFIEASAGASTGARAEGGTDASTPADASGGAASTHRPGAGTETPVTAPSAEGARA